MVKKILFLNFILLIPFISYAKMYEIREPDFVESARAFAETEEFKKLVEEEAEKQINTILATKGEPLLEADRDMEYEVEYYYSLPEDMPKIDGDGNVIGVLYPKGYTFAPLKYLRMAPPPLIIYNPCDEEERELVEKIKSAFNSKYQQYMLITTGCSLEEMSKIKLGTHTRFVLDKEAVEKFKLKYTVSVVSVDIVKGVFNVRVFAKDSKLQNNKDNNIK